jgi:hypothetical protein
MCDYLARPVRRELETFAKTSSGKSRGCQPAVASLSARTAADRADTLTTGIATLRIKGNMAFALFYGPNASKYVMPMLNENGTWKVTRLAPVPYPLGSTGVATP